MKSMLATLTLAVAALHAAPAAAINCGDMVTADTVLQKDLSCPGHSPAITIRGPVIIDMAGHRLIGCAEKGIGIDLAGAGAVLRRGAVVDCDTGVRIGGLGGHRVEDFAVRNADVSYLIESGGNHLNRTLGIHGGGYRMVPGRLGSGDNKLTDNAAVRTEFGFDLTGNRGTYVGNVASNSSGNGFTITGDANTLKRNLSRRSYDAGFQILGNDNRLERNVAEGNAQDGFEMPAHWNSTSNHLSHNAAIANERAGYVIGPETRFVANAAVANQHGGIESRSPAVRLLDNRSIANRGAGFLVAGDSSVVRNNRCMITGSGGIVIGNGKGIEISKNVSLGHVEDLADLSPSCGGHKWSKNVFSTRNQVCAK